MYTHNAKVLPLYIYIYIILSWDALPFTLWGLQMTIQNPDAKNADWHSLDDLLRSFQILTFVIFFTNTSVGGLINLLSLVWSIDSKGDD